MVCDSVENGEDLFNSGLRFRGGPINLVGDGDGGEVGGVTGCGSLFTKEVAVCPNTEVSSACGEFRKDVVTVPCGDKGLKQTQMISSAPGTHPSVKTTG